MKRQEALSPAAHYYFMTGIFPHMHVCGARDDRTWNCEADRRLPPCVGTVPLSGGMALLMQPEDERAALWMAHREALTVEAQRFGFVPAAEGTTGETPLAAAVTAEWRRAFMGRFGRATRPRNL